MLQKACKHLGIDIKTVLSSKEYDDHIVIVWDNGIKGCPKVAVQFSELKQPLVDPVEVEAKKVDGLKRSVIAPVPNVARPKRRKRKAGK